jgi:hypothetical protein
MSTFRKAYVEFAKAKSAGVLGHGGIIDLRCDGKGPIEVWSGYWHLCTFKTAKSLMAWLQECTSAGHFVKPTKGYVGVNREVEITARIDAEIARNKAKGGQT